MLRLGYQRRGQEARRRVQLVWLLHSMLQLDAPKLQPLSQLRLLHQQLVRLPHSNYPLITLMPVQKRLSNVRVVRRRLRLVWPLHSRPSLLRRPPLGPRVRRSARDLPRRRLQEWLQHSRRLNATRVLWLPAQGRVQYHLPHPLRPWRRLSRPLLSKLRPRAQWSSRRVRAVLRRARRRWG